MIDISPDLQLIPKKDKLVSPEPNTSEILGGIRGYNIANQTITYVNIASQTIINNNINQKSRTYDAIVDAGGNGDFTTIEGAVAYTESIGGGDIFIWGGTYAPSSTITITKPTNLVGQSAALVTVTFNGTARNFTIQSSGVYTTGTITVASGTAITGSGTLWLTNTTAGQYLFIGTRWYKIASVTDNTHLVLSQGYFDNVTLPTTYRIATVPKSISFEGMVITGSTGTAIIVTDCTAFLSIGMVLVANNKGITLTNTDTFIFSGTVVQSSTSNGAEFTNCGLSASNGFQTNGNGGHGVVITNCKVVNFLACESVGNTIDGVNITGSSLVQYQVNARSNGGQGIELVSGNDRIILDECDLVSNVSDGIKLTATSNFCKIMGCHFDTNGGYGVNIAATDNKNVVVGNSFNGNVSGTVLDSGTGDVVANNTL